MKTALFLSRKLSLKSDGKKSTPAVKVATAAVALSLAVMIAALAIVGGFKREIRNRVIGFNSHISVYVSPSDGSDNSLTLTPTLRNLLDSIPYITDFTLQAAIPAILKTPNDFKGVYFKGSEPGEGTDFLAQNIERGSLPDFSKPGNKEKILISRTAADKLNLKLGDTIDTYFISDRLQTRRLHIAGIFNTHFGDYDDLFIYGPLSMVQEIAGLSAMQGSSMQIYTDDFYRVNEYAADLNNRLVEELLIGRLNKQYKVETVESRGAHYFQWLSLLDTNVAVILILMTIVACITLISGMLIIILDKIRFIGLMKAMGAGNQLLRQVFILLAIKIAAVGVIIGDAISLILLYIQDRTHFLPLDADSYYIDFVPVELNPWQIVSLNIAVILVVSLVLLLPSSFVARISPARALHGE